MSEKPPIGIRGAVIDAPEYGKLRAHLEGAIIFKNDKITHVGPFDQLRRHPDNQGVRWFDSQNKLIVPGLIDIHTHLPQYPAVARGECELLPWLRQLIFPLEREFSGQRTLTESTLFFQELLRHGTTTASVFTAIFEDSCDAAFLAAEKCGIRALIGKMMMDVGSYGTHQPRKVVSISVLESERLCQKWHGKADGRLDYIFSPRFAVSCSDKLMRSVAVLAEKYGAYIQTHLAENREEIAKVNNLFMWSESYTDVYDKCGMLGPRTLLGHCIHLGEREIERLVATNSKIAHCPTSNLYLGSGIMPLDKLRRAGLTIGLGSDVAAGPEINMWQVMRSAVESQKMRSFYEDGVERFGPVEAFHLATKGGADALSKSELIGSLEPGKSADFLVMDIAALLPYGRKIKTFAAPSAEDLIAMAVYRGNASAVLDTYVAGEPVYQAPSRDLFS